MEKKYFTSMQKTIHFISVQGALDDAFPPDKMQKSLMRLLRNLHNKIEEASSQLLKLNLHGFFLEFRCFKQFDVFMSNLR